MNFDKKIIQQNFSRKAFFYNNNSDLQLSSAQNLVNLSKRILKNHDRIIDLGSGTSFIAKNLILDNYNYEIFEVDFSQNMLNSWVDRPKNIYPILSDIENLPFKKEPYFDLIISSFALQWISDFQKLSLQLNSILKNNGFFAFCLPSKGTLQEIVECSKKSNCNFNFIDFKNINYIIKSLDQSGFKKIFYKTRIFKKEYINGNHCLKMIKNIGAGYSKKNREPVTKENLQKFNDFFKQRYKNTTSWHISYFIFQK